MSEAIKQRVKHWAHFATFPIRSVVDGRFSPCVFLPTTSGWKAWTHGRIIPIAFPCTQAVEYYRERVPRRGGIVFDVGGELGLETLQFSQLVGPEGKVFTFECYPPHLNRLRELAKQRSNIIVVPKACWDCQTCLDLMTGHTPGSNTAIPNARGQRGQALGNSQDAKTTVEADTLDNIWMSLHGGATVDFLKMDIEGAEYEALAGAKEMLKKTRYAVIAAYHLRDGIRTAWKVAQQLQTAGFEVSVGDNLHVYATNTSMV
jgi:FkbM family methyltransferase